MEQPCLLATGGYDHSVRLWQTTDSTYSKVLQHPDSVSARPCVSALMKTMGM